MKKICKYSGALMVVCSILFSINTAFALTAKEAGQVLSSGLNPDGTTANSSQLQEANQVFYSWYNNQPSVTSAANAGSGNSDNSTATTNAKCTGDTTTNYIDAQVCASLAQTEGAALGYNISCKVNINFLPGINPATGLSYYLDPTCTVNGQPNHSAVLLAGYEAGPTTSSNPNTHSGNVGPGWSILATELSRTTTGSGAGSGSITNTTSPGQSSYTSASGSTSYASSLINLLQNQIQQAQTALQSVTTVPAWTIPTAQTISNGNAGATNINNNNASSGFPKTIAIVVNLVNVRSGADTAASIIGQMTKNQTFVATGVVNGETVHGENHWWLRQTGGYIWSGNTDGGIPLAGTTGGNTNGTVSGTTSGGTGQPSNSPTVAGPTTPALSACQMPAGTHTTDQFGVHLVDPIDYCIRVKMAIDRIRAIPGQIYSFTGDIGVYILTGYGVNIAINPLVQAEIPYTNQKIAWFKQMYGNVSVLLNSDNSPASGSSKLIVNYDIATRKYSWRNGFSPVNGLYVDGNIPWSLKDLFTQTKNNPPSTINPSSQVAVIIGLGDDTPTTGTTRNTEIGTSYTFNSTVWTKN